MSTSIWTVLVIWIGIWFWIALYLKSEGKGKFFRHLSGLLYGSIAAMAFVFIYGTYAKSIPTGDDESSMLETAPAAPPAIARNPVQQPAIKKNSD